MNYLPEEHDYWEPWVDSWTGKPADDLDRQRVKNSAQRTIDRANRDIERAERKLEAIEKFGEDTYEDETVLLFYKKFSTGTKSYTYAALKVAGKWYLTGPRQSGLYYNWGGLINFVVGTNAVEDVEVWRVDTWERIV